MANCYICGRHFQASDFQLRRKVRTGGSEHLKFGRDRAVSVRRSYGMRIVCPFCAKRIDDGKQKEILVENWKLIGAVTLLILVTIARLLNW